MSASPDESADKLNVPHPRMLRAGSPVDPRKSGEDHGKAIGQAFEWALDRARITKQEAAYRMGYTDSGVIGRWISGKENLQLARTRLIGEEFFQEFLVALAQTCAGVDVKTTITLAKVG